MGSGSFGGTYGVRGRRGEGEWRWSGMATIYLIIAAIRNTLGWRRVSAVISSGIIFAPMV